MTPLFYWIRVGDPGWPTVYQGFDYYRAREAAQEPIARDKWVIADYQEVGGPWGRQVWSEPHPYVPSNPHDRGAYYDGVLDPGCKSPASIDPVLSRRSMEKLKEFLRRPGAKYGDIDYETISGMRYAFRYAEHPPDAGVNAAHPGVDYLICGKATVPQGGETSVGMVLATGAVVVGVPLALWWGLSRFRR